MSGVRTRVTMLGLASAYLELKLSEAILDVQSKVRKSETSAAQYDRDHFPVAKGQDERLGSHRFHNYTLPRIVVPGKNVNGTDMSENAEEVEAVQ